MNTLLKNMMLALLSLGIGQAAWAEDVPDLQKTLQSAKQGNADAQFNLGLMYESGRGVRQDYTKAVQWYRKAAGQGHAKAQYNLGGMYANGKGVLQNLVQAEQWYRKAAEQGIAEAQYNLGVMYDNGQGVRQNYKIAKEWFGKACDNGIQLGCDAYRELNQAGY